MNQIEIQYSRSRLIGKVHQRKKWTFVEFSRVIVVGINTGFSTWNLTWTGLICQFVKTAKCTNVLQHIFFKAI